MRTTPWEIAVDLRSWPSNGLTYEADYNLRAKRLSAPEVIGKFPFEGAWCAVAPGQTSTAHAHHEREIFFFFGGTGTVRVGDEAEPVAYGDEVHIRPGVEHEVTNDGADDLVYLSIWFPTGEATPA
ncbi:mannose-6-phosphate isomerase-like protein (cupin superfamily) [Saccharopolyspora gloriosae]|uniref:Mannose-6-phosphate isomerase-like protein (Cupin superfamily) n=1 Tax=Saccharopolyspora gloriosae TaxID=455344 RepID=A0A840NJI0_9PSEU|nr:cupin domain-containing protein [Saccharopolyspora gloriosae]MBB5070195.1 mannose-6-phosphate isomerase-like protein (cupin superfamily) [Saccharopolyspora gloriosae]